MITPNDPPWLFPYIRPSWATIMVGMTGTGKTNETATPSTILVALCPVCLVELRYDEDRKEWFCPACGRKE